MVEKRVFSSAVPADQPTVQDLLRLVEQLQWKHEGRDPLSVFEKTPGLVIPKAQFWLKLALLLSPPRSGSRTR